MKKQIPILGFIVISLGITGCSEMKVNSRMPSSTSLGSSQDNDDAPGGNGDIVAQAQARTASIASANRALDNMVACTGLGQASTAARNVYLANAGSLSLDGKANTVTGPMFTSLLAIGAQVCNDLITAERGQAADARRIFNRINFDGGAGGVSTAAVQDSVRRLARSCWGRNETASELQMIQTNMAEAFPSGSTANATLRTVYFCSAMLASFSAIDM